MNLDQILRDIRPFVEGWIRNVQASGGMLIHDLSSSLHTGTLADSQAPQFLKSDGSRTLTGNLPVGTGVTIDGVDLDVFQSTYTAHLTADSHSQYAAAEGSGLTRRAYEAGRLNLSITAGTGLSGGGLMTASQTLSVNQGYAFTWSALHIFSSGLTAGALITANAGLTASGLITANAGATVAAGQNLNFGADVAISRKTTDVLQLAAGDELQSNSFASGISGWRIDSDGSAEFANARVRGELSSTIFKVNEIQATAGTFGVFKSASSLSRDIATPASVGNSFHVYLKTSDAGAALVAINDILRIKTWDGSAIRDAWMTVTAISTAAGESDCTCTLSSGSTNAAIKTGTAVVDYGPSGSGFIALSADGAIGSSANMTIADHAGSPWSATTLRVRMGNLNGSYGRVTNLYGIGIGDYAGGNYLSYDGTTGLTLKGGNGVATIDSTGIALNAPSAFNDSCSYKFTSGATKVGGLYGSLPGTLSYLSLKTYPVAGLGAQLDLFAESPSGQTATVFVGADDSAGGHSAILEFQAGPSGAYASMVAGLSLGFAPLASEGYLNLDGGINVGSATGATAGQIVTSGNIYISNGNSGNLIIPQIDSNRVGYIQTEQTAGLGYGTGQTLVVGSYNGYGAFYSQRISFRTFNIERMVIEFDGRVGIGTSSPTSKLHVVGLPVYANNAAATTAGLTVGAFYRNGANPDLVCIVH